MDDATVVYEDVETSFFDKGNSKNKTKPKPTTVKGKTTKKKPSSKKKGKLGLEYNSPVTLTFSLICFFSFLFVHFFAKENFLIFSSPTCQGTNLAFSATIPSHYVRLFTYVFGYTDWNNLFSTLLLLLLLGPNLETTYGSKLVFIMILISSFGAGVLGACFSSISLSGANSIIFMMIVISTYSAIEKKKLPLTLVFVCCFFFAQTLISCFSNYSTLIPALVSLIGGFFGCIFGFIATPIQKNKKV